VNAIAKRTLFVLPQYAKILRCIQLLFGLLMVGGCVQPAASARILADSVDSNRSLSITEISAAATRPQAIHLSAAINETIGFRFTIESQDTAIAAPGFSITPLKSTEGAIDSSAVQLFRMSSVSVPRLPGWHIRQIPPAERVAQPLDVLVPISAPRGGLPQRIEPKQTIDFWADLLVSKGTPAGIYNGQIQLLSGKQAVTSIGLELTVWSFVLPDESGVSMIAELDHTVLSANASDETATTAAMRMVHDHRIVPVLRKMHPQLNLGASAELHVDWSQFDAIVRPFMDGSAFVDRRGLPYWPVPIEGLFETSMSSAPLAASPKFIDGYLKDCMEHFSSAGWTPRTYLMLPTDVCSNADANPVLAAVDRIHAGGPTLPVASPCFPQDMRPFGWVNFSTLSSSLQPNIWCPPAQFYDSKAMAEERGRGRQSWMRIDRPPFSGSTSIVARPTDTRVTAWQLDKAGATVGMLGFLNRWPRFDATAQDCIAGDANALIYPGAAFGLTEPVPSMRLKRLRRSMQDEAYVRLLREHHLEHLADTIRDSLIAYAGTDAYRTSFADGKLVGWPDDPEVFEAARRLMADELSTSAYGEERGGREEFARSTSWRRFLLATRRVEERFEGARMRVRGDAAAKRADVVTSWTIANRTRLPVEANLNLGPLPESWTVAEHGSDRRTIHLDSGESRRVSFAYSVPLGGGESGKTLLPLTINADPDVRSRASGRFACLIADSLAGPLKFDGDLSDWPLGTTNVAGDFRLISGAKTVEDRPDVSIPRKRTTAFVLKDAEFLYVAVNCELDKGSERPIGSKTGITYDDLIPIGEELVEVLIDPLNSGSRSPGDLLHIVVKQSGASVLEKGITTAPPCCQSSPWAAKVEIATRSNTDRWTAEIRIPLADISPPPYSQAVWGFNVTRFDAGGEEFSTWSEAVGNAYDPLSLGNLVLP